MTQAAGRAFRRKLGAALLAGGLATAAAHAQDAGALRSGAESYHDTIPGESVNGVALDFKQLLPFGGLIQAEVVLVDRKDRSAFGRGVLRLTDLELAGARVSAEGGDFSASLDAIPFHFGNDYLPVAYLRGGAVRAQSDRLTVSLFDGRNEQFQGIRLPTVVFAPESVTGATAAYRIGERLVLDGSALRTSNQVGAINPLFGVPVPDHAETVGVGATLRLTDSWIAQVRPSYATYAYPPDSPSSSGHFLSFVAGTALDTDRWKGQADYIREGVNYVPLSTASSGNREGPYVWIQSLRERLTATASFSSYRNNLEANPEISDLHSRSFFGSALVRVSGAVSTVLSYSQQDLDSRRGGNTSEFTQKTAATQLLFPSFGSTHLRYQYQATDEPTLHQRLHEVEIEQQPPTILGVDLIAALRFQRSDDGASSILYRGGVNGSIGDVHWNFQGDFGRDLAASTVFALNRTQTVTAGLSIALPGALELRVEGYWNRVSAVVNPESLFVSQATQEQLFSYNRRSLLVRVARVFQWGRQPMTTTQGFGSSGPFPYGSVEGFVFQDLNGNGVREPGEPPAAGIFVLLDDGQTAKTDAAGHFSFPNVIEGQHTVGLDLEVLPVFYNPPAEEKGRVRVQRLEPGRRNFGLMPTGSVSGTVEQTFSSGERAGFRHAVVTLLPNDLSVYTDSDGRYRFSNLPPGRYSVRLEEISLPDGAVVEAGQSEELELTAGEEGSVPPLVFSLRIEEKPVQKIFEHEQTISPEPSTPKRSQGSRQNHSR